MEFRWEERSDREKDETGDQMGREIYPTEISDQEIRCGERSDREIRQGER